MSKNRYEFGLYNVENISDLKGLLEMAAENYGDRLAFIFTQDNRQIKISYTQLYKDVQLAAAGLMNALKIDLSRRDGKKIALIANNSYRWVVTYLAIVTLNQVVVPLDPQLPVCQLLEFIQRAGVSSIVYETAIDDKIADFKNTLTKIRHYLCLDDLGRHATLTWERLLAMGRKFARKNKNFYEQIRIFPETLAVILFTSGTTGRPRGVMLTHKNLCADTVGIAALQQYREETLLSILPLHHIYELSVGLNLQLYAGSTLYYLPGGLKAFQENLRQVQPTALMLVPLIVEGTYKRVCQSCGKNADPEQIQAALREYYGGRLKRVLVAGASLNGDVVDVYEAAGIKIFQAYGETECSPAITISPDRYRKPDSVGLPLPNLRVELDQKDETGVGEIIVRGSAVTLGYYKQERATDEVIVDNWLHTGDYGRFDKDGFLYIVGRKKNVIVGKNALNVYPEEVEMCLSTLPGIKEAMVYGKLIGDDTRPAVLIVPDKVCLRQLHPDKVLNEEHILQLINDQVTLYNNNTVKYKRLVDVQLVESLPRTTIGKVKRKND